jgi:hypothetical protein
LLEKAEVKRVSVSKAASRMPSLEESQPRSYDELRDTVRGDFIAFHETLQKLHGLVEDLDISEVQRTLPGMLADGDALAALRSLYSSFLVGWEAKGTSRPFWAVLRPSQTISGPGRGLALSGNRGPV